MNYVVITDGVEETWDDTTATYSRRVGSEVATRPYTQAEQAEAAQRAISKAQAERRALIDVRVQALPDDIPAIQTTQDTIVTVLADALGVTL